MRSIKPLEKSKDASLAELDDAFDQRAEQIMTVQFWAGFREESDKDLNDFLKQAKANAVRWRKKRGTMLIRRMTLNPETNPSSRHANYILLPP